MIGTTVSHYRIISHIGAGGMGTVYLAEDTNLKRRVALKFLSPGRAAIRDAAARLLREARAASALDHPHIATVYEIGDHAGQPFIAMAHYEGETLALASPAVRCRSAEVARHRRTGGRRARRRARRRDRPSRSETVEPDADDDGPGEGPRLRAREDRHGRDGDAAHAAGSTVGTAAYMSPEQAAGEDGGRTVGSLVARRRHLRDAGGSRAVRRHEHAGDHPGGADGHDLPHPNAAARCRPGVGRGREPDAGARPRRGARSRRRKCAISRRRVTRGWLVRTTAGRRAAADVRAATVGCAAVVASPCAAGGIAWWAQRNAKVRWARQEALPEIIRLAGADKFDDAYRLAQQAQPYIRGRSTPRRTDAGDLPTRGHRLRIRPAPTSSIVRTAAAASPGGRSATRRSRTRGATRPAALEGGDGRPRDGGRRRSVHSHVGAHPLHALAGETRPRPGWCGSHRPDRAVQTLHPRP